MRQFLFILLLLLPIRLFCQSERLIRINEIMADPKGLSLLPETEYIELQNQTDKALPLGGWRFSYGGKMTTLTDLSLPARGYVVLYRSGRLIHVDAPGLGLPLDKFPSQLANTGKEIALYDASGVLIDAIAYGKAKPGVAWERVGDELYLSEDRRGGTPGSANSIPDPGTSHPDEPDENPDEPEDPDQPEPPVVAGDAEILPGEIIFNELLPNPFPEGSEYIELYNRSDRTLSLSGLSVATRKTDGSLSTRYPLSSWPAPFHPGEYALLTKSVDGVTPYYLISSPDALHELKLPVLANTSAALVLFLSNDETVIDEVSYSSKWHAISVKEQKGVSLERIDPDSDSRDAANWTSAAATAGFGTPGYRNSQYQSTDEGTTGIDSPVYSEQTGEYIIAYHLDEPGYTCRAWVFDTAGRRISEVANHESLGTAGELRWNGLMSNGNKVRVGIYLLYAELIHPTGPVRRYKMVFLVR